MCVEIRWEIVGKDLRFKTVIVFNQVFPLFSRWTTVWMGRFREVQGIYSQLGFSTEIGSLRRIRERKIKRMRIRKWCGNP